MDKLVVLIAEDDPIVAELVADALTEAGFDIVPVSNGQQALTALGAAQNRFAAIITDIRLGDGIDGWEVGRRARQAAPDIPVVYTSGSDAADWPVYGVPNSQMITKPFAPAQLVTAVTTLLNETAAAKTSNQPQ